MGKNYTEIYRAEAGIDFLEMEFKRAESGLGWTAVGALSPDRAVLSGLMRHGFGLMGAVWVDAKFDKWLGLG